MNIKREAYLKRIRPFYDKPLIKILIGQRRVGKSYLLRQIMDEIRDRNKKANIIFIDKEKYSFSAITDEHSMIAYVQKNIKNNAPNYLFIDEVQEISAFEKALRSLLNESIADIYCTGSNAHIFSAQLATLLSGRHIEIKIHPLSYPEFLEFNQLQKGGQSLNDYLRYGGLPFLIHLPKEDDVIFEYLQNIIATIIYKDVLNRNQIRDASFLDDLIVFLADNAGSIFSARSIHAFLKSLQINKSVSSIINYVRFLEEALIISKVKRRDVQGKKIFESGEKYYFEDIGIRNTLTGYRPQDINKILENVVYNHLVFCGYSLHVGKSGNKEIDFIAEKNNEIRYIQVTYLLQDERTIKREFGNLDAIKDHYPKYVISMDPFPINVSYKGIRIQSLLEFLSTEI